MAELFVGLISGTSMDGIDAVLVADDGHSCRLLAHHAHCYPEALRQCLHALCLPGDNEIDRLGEADRAVAACFAEATHAVLAAADVKASAVRAIGSHGQTIRHRPQAQWPFTLQLGDANTLAALTGIDTVADFRRADMAAGGQGAPLVPAFHQALLAKAGQPRVVVNIGGIANVTWLPGDDSPVLGFDTGPGNTLMDRWCQRHRHQPFDAGGAWAASGQPDTALLATLLADPYFQLPAPKSTGREQFHLAWLETQAGARLHALAPEDVQATLLQLPASTLARAIQPLAPRGEVLVCGGGAHNQRLMAALAAQLPQWQVTTTSAMGVDGDYLEAMAFAWLAARHVRRQPGNLPAVTGARYATVLGGYYPAPRRLPVHG